MNLPLQVLTVKILRLQGGNSIIFNLGGKTKILSYVSCFYQKSLAKKKNKPFLRKCLLTILRYVSYCFFPFQSFPQIRALLIFRQRSTCITEIPKGSTLGVFTSHTHYHQKASAPDITLGPRQAMKSGAGELAIARGRVAKYLRFIIFFQIEQKKT